MSDVAGSHARTARLDSQARSHPGARRTLNEDRVLDRPDLGFWAVADGMGGLAGGDRAAGRVAEAVAAAADRGGSGYMRLGKLLAALDQVNAELHRETARPEDASGSTIVALLVHEGHFACLWAGDSRAYLYRCGKLSQITRDHSVIQQLVDEGVVTDAARRTHPFAHVLTRAVGTSQTVEIERCFGPVQPGDLFLLCSDGLTNALSEEFIEAALRGDDLEGAADALIAQALRQDASDNVSVVLVRQP